MVQYQSRICWKWLLGNGKNIKLWEDSWFGEPLQETLNLSQVDTIFNGAYPKIFFLNTFMSGYLFYKSPSLLKVHKAS